MPRQPFPSTLGILVLTALLALAAGSALAEDAPPAGSVKSSTGVAQVARNKAAPAQLKPGDRIFEKDVLTTDAQSSLGLVMRDNSVLSLGPESRLVVESFQFAPEKGALASVMRLAKGSAACITGEIAKLSPGTVQVLTPTAVIGIRGTHFLVHAEGGPDMEPKTEGGR